MITISNTYKVEGHSKGNEDQSYSLPRSFGKCLQNKPETLPLRTVPNSVQEVENTLEIIEYALHHFSLMGTLKQDARGFLYVDLPDAFIYELYSLIHADGIELPPYFGGERSYGAHISVILAREAKENQLIGEISELGRDVEFTITGCFHVKPDGWKEMERVWFLTIDCPELESLRQKYGLSPKIDGHDFHITLAFKRAAFPELNGYNLPIQALPNYKKVSRNYV